MPARQPFTYLCQQLAKGPGVGRADLHLHTTASDGTYTPVQIVELARRSGLAAIAITDHDTFAGVVPAREAARGTSLEVIVGVEITTEHRERELHLLGYFVDLQCEPLGEALRDIRQGRVERFHAMVERLADFGVPVELESAERSPDALGRRYLAELLVQQGKAGSIREAFQRWLGDRSPVAVAKRRLPVGEAIALVREAGGVASWAHPNCDGEALNVLVELTGMGLGAVEVEYPDMTRSQRDKLRRWAGELGLAISGGSDCHGPGKRTPGACSVSDAELARLRTCSCRGA